MMLTKVLSLLLLFALPFGNAASQNTDSGTILGCTPPKETRSSGFEVAYYHYPMQFVHQIQNVLLMTLHIKVPPTNMVVMKRTVVG